MIKAYFLPITANIKLEFLCILIKLQINSPKIPIYPPRNLKMWTI